MHLKDGCQELGGLHLKELRDNLLLDKRDMGKPWHVVESPFFTLPCLIALYKVELPIFLFGPQKA